MQHHTEPKLLNYLEKSKQTSIWSVCDHSYQGILEYGVVLEVKTGNQFLISNGFNSFLGITLKGFKLHNTKIQKVILLFLIHELIVIVILTVSS
jgi:hypothetical protein